MSARINSLYLLRPEFRATLELVQSDLAGLSIPLAIFESIRSPARQNELYGRGRDPGLSEYGRTVTKARAYQSAHQHGLAVDFVFRVDGKWTWDEPEGGMWAQFHRIARARGLRPLSFEMPHLQVEGFDWTERAFGPIDEAGWLEWLRVA